MDVGQSINKKVMNVETEEDEINEVCGIDGCEFLGPKSVLEQHILYLHSSGLYNRLAKVDDPEEIEKWRAQRRKKYPRSEEAEERKKKEEERKREFEVIKRKRAEEYQKFLERRAEKWKKIRESSKTERRTKGNKRKRTSKNKDVKKYTSPSKQKENYLDDEDDPEGWNGTLHMFPGTSGMNNFNQEPESSDEDSVVDNGLISDEEIDGYPSAKKLSLNAQSTCVVEKYEETNSEKSPENESNHPEESLSKMSSLNDEDDDFSKEVIKVSSEIVEKESAQNKNEALSDDDPPEETRIERKEEEKQPIEDNASIKCIENSLRNTDNYMKSLERVNEHSRKKKQGTTLLQKLLKKDISKEHAEILQCVKYVCENNFFMDL